MQSENHLTHDILIFFCSIEKEVGPSHDRKFICSVRVEIQEGILFVEGDEKFRVKDAENSAASGMLFGLKGSKYIWTVHCSREAHLKSNDEFIA